MHASSLRMHCRAVTQLIALTTLVSQTAEELIITPHNIESKVGDTAYFNCSTNLTSKEIFWQHGERYIYTADVTGILPPYHERFEIDRNESIGSHNLVIHSVKPSDAGEYICIDDDGIGARRSAELVVLDDDLDCRSNIQPDGVIGQNIFKIPPDEVQLICSVTYYGSNPPHMEWKKVGYNSPITDNVSSDISSSNRKIYTLRLKGDISLENSSYVCQTTRSTKNQYQCASEIIKILYFVGGNTTRKNVIRGHKIACIASNNTFPCASQWYHDNYSCPLSCDETITTHLLGLYLCTVKCNVRGKDYYFEALKAFVVEDTTPPPPSKPATIAASIVVPIVVIILVVLIGVYIVRYVKRKNRTRTRDLIKNLNVDEAELEWLSAAGIVDKPRQRVKPSVDEIAEEEIDLLHKLQESTDTREEAIRGVTILCGKLFIVREISSNLEVCDGDNFSNFRKLPDVEQLVDAVDICSCKTNNCLYVMDKKDGVTRKEVLRLSAYGVFENYWKTEDNAGGYLSIAPKGNILITVQYKHRLLEYSSEGVFLGEIKLSGGISPWHAIKVDDDRYIVSHGTIFESVHRVCQVNKEGKIEKSFGDKSGSAENQLNKPFYLAVTSDGCVIVADLGNNRVLLLDSDLKFKANIIPKSKQKFRRPRRIFLDEEFLVVVTTAVDPRETKPAAVAGRPNSGDETEKGGTLAMYESLLRETMSKRMTKVDPNQLSLIEGNCSLLVFDIQPLIRKYTCRLSKISS